MINKFYEDDIVICKCISDRKCNMRYRFSENNDDFYYCTIDLNGQKYILNPKHEYKTVTIIKEVGKS
jgi:hypothetical protein